MADETTTSAVINNVAYSWSMIQLQMTGTMNSAESAATPILVDCTAIKWNTERKVESIYGLGGQPRKRGFGNVTYEASITLPFGTQIYLRSLSADGTLLGLGEFDITITWLNDLAANVTTESVTLGACLFTQSGMEANQDDTSITKEFDLHPHRIYTNAVQEKTTSWGHEMYSGA